MLDESGISVAPPPRSRLASSTALPAPSVSSSKLSNTRQRRPDLPATGSTQINQWSRSVESDNESSETDKSITTSESDTKVAGTNDDEQKDHDECKGSPDNGVLKSTDEGKLFYHYTYLNLRKQTPHRTRCDQDWQG